MRVIVPRKEIRKQVDMLVQECLVDDTQVVFFYCCNGKLGKIRLVGSIKSNKYRTISVWSTRVPTTFRRTFVSFSITCEIGVSIL